MLISHSHKFIFVHVPRTAGSSLCHALIPYFHYNLRLEGDMQTSWVDMFERIREVPSHDQLKADDRMRLEILLRHIRKVNRDEFIALYEESNPAMFSKLIKSYMNEAYPKYYSRLFIHNKARDIKDEIPAEVYDPYYKFLFVRNPFDWVVSFYHATQQIEGPLQSHASKYPTFESFVNFMYQCKKEGRVNDIMGGRPWETMADYAFDENDNSLVDFIGKYETLQSDFDVLRDKLGLETQIPHVNASKRKKYLSYYNDDLRDKVSFILERDLELFKYKGIES